MIDQWRDRRRHDRLEKHKRPAWDKPFFTTKGDNKAFGKLAAMEIAIAFIALVLTKALGLW
jgi:hypothetical protein